VFGPAAPESVRDITVSAVSVISDGARLAELAELVDQGRLTPRVNRTYPLAAAAAAHRAFAEGGVRGRIVLVP